MSEHKYSFDDFKQCCIENPSDVIPHKDALDGANELFGLKTKSELLNFIGYGGLEELTYINTTPWRNNPDQSLVILVDAYEFRTLSKLGYIAFMRNQKTDKWVIKSFKPSKNSNFAIADALQKSRINWRRLI